MGDYVNFRYSQKSTEIYAVPDRTVGSTEARKRYIQLGTVIVMSIALAKTRPVISKQEYHVAPAQSISIPWLACTASRFWQELFEKVVGVFKEASTILSSDVSW